MKRSKKLSYLVEKEIEEIADSTENSKLEVDQIQEDEEAYNLYAPGNGFSFYIENHEIQI